MSNLPRVLLVLLTAGFAAALTLLPGTAAEPARQVGDAPFLEKRWAQPTIREEPTRNWVQNQAARYLEDRGLPVLPAFYPLAVRGKALFRSHWGLHAVDLQTGKLEWESDSRWSLDRMVREPGKSGALNQWVAAALAAGRAHVLFENSTLGTLSTNGKLVYAVEDLAVAPPNVPNQDGSGMTYGPPVADGVQHSRLQAFDVDTGKLIWELGGRGGADEFHDSFFLSAPLVLDGKLYLLNEKEGNLRLVALDPAKGTLLSTLHLASFRARLPQDPERRMHAALLAHGDGVLVCPTNAGVIVGVDLASNTLLWANGYQQGEVAAAPPAGSDPERIARLRQLQRAGAGNAPFLGFRWKDTAPAIQDGKVVFTAPDGQSVVCLNLRDGAVAWKTRAAPDDLYFAGVVGSKVLVVGKKSCRALNLADGKTAWTVETGLPSGRGVVADGVYYLPLKAAIGTQAPEVCSLDVEKGAILAHTRSRKDVPGNLFFHDGSVLSQTIGEVAVYPMLRTKLAQIDDLLKKDPRDPTGLTERGELKLAKGDLQGAVDDLHLALENNPPADVKAKARAKLHETLTDLLQRDFDAGEKYLGEYETLCAVDVPANATAAERQALDAEGKRRRADFHFLTARGREGQSKFVEALRSYLEFVAVAGDEELVSVPDDPAVKAPRDRWAGGRITALLARSTPPQRKLLEEEIARKWQEVKKGDDPAAMEAFVRVFGTGSTVGREARLVLGERLLAEKAFLEAELHLLQLRRQTDDPALAAKALEALARLYLGTGLLEDAAASYRALARDHAKVAVRDGKTGADFLTDATADKRLLPYLDEANAYPEGKIKVTEHPGNNPPTQTATFEPVGDVPPYFLRHRLALNLNLHQFKLIDRSSGEERWSQNLTRTQFQGFLYSGQQYSSMTARYQTAGHVVILSLGHMVFGLDPVNRKVLWEKNLLGQNILANVTNIMADPQDGTPQVVYQDGWVQRLGQTGPVGPGHVCLLTRDGLLALDPRTGATLWARSDVSMRAEIFGDDRFVCLVERNPEGQPVATKVLRAADGVAVEAPDFTVAYRARPRTVGSKLLASEAHPSEGLTLRLYDVVTGKDQWARRFPVGSLPLTAADPDLAGVIEPSGLVTFIDLGTRETVRAAVEPKHLENAPRVHVWRDRFQVYLAPEGKRDPNAVAQGLGPTPAFVPGAGVRSLPVSGVVYAFDRASGQLRWRAEAMQQMAVLDPQEDLPVLVLAYHYVKVVANQAVAQGQAVRLIDKRTGKLLYDQPEMANAPQFHTAAGNPAAGTLELVSPTLKLRAVLEK